MKATVVEPSSSLDLVVCENSSRGYAASIRGAPGVDVNFRWHPQLTDPKDELVLETAVIDSTDALVTPNARDFRTAAPRFGLRVLLPRELLKELEP